MRQRGSSRRQPGQRARTQYGTLSTRACDCSANRRRTSMSRGCGKGARAPLRRGSGLIFDWRPRGCLRPSVVGEG
eukprot:5237680-Alexandrium_andersonii.AAC.1